MGERDGYSENGIEDKNISSRELGQLTVLIKLLHRKGQGRRVK